EWISRWFETSTLSRRTREHAFFDLIKAGRWLHREHPDRAEPGSWDRELAAAWVAAVDRFLVGEMSKAPNTNYMRARSGLPDRGRAGLRRAAPPPPAPAARARGALASGPRGGAPAASRGPSSTV